MTTITAIKSLVREQGAHFPHVQVGGFTLSVQAGNYLYSSPRVDLDTLGEYEQVEIAIFRGDSFFNPLQELPDGDWPPSYAYDDVGGYVTWEQLERVLLQLEQA